MELKKRFGRRLRMLRELQGMTQAALAESASLAEQYLGRIERGLASPSFDVIERLAKALCVDPADFFMCSPSCGRCRQPDGCEALSGTWELDAATGALHWSDSMYRLLGCEPGAFPPDLDAYRSHVPADDLPKVDEALAALMRGESVPPYRARLKGDDGIERLVEARGELEFSGKGELRRIYGVVVDVTGHLRQEARLASVQDRLEAVARRQGEELRRIEKDLLRESVDRARAVADFKSARRRLAGILDGMEEGFIELDGKDAVLSLNKKALADIGLPRHRVVGRAVWNTVPAVRLSEFPDALRQARSRGADVSLAGYSEPSRRWYAVKIHPLGRSMALYYRDVTGAREMERALAESERRFKTVIDGIDDMVWMSDADHVFTFVSRGGGDLLGYESGELVGRQVTDFVTPAGLQTIKHVVLTRRIKEAQGVRDHVNLFEVEVRAKDGGIAWAEVSSRPMYDERGAKTGYAGVTRNMTHRRLAEAALREGERRYRALFTQSAQGVVLASRDAVVLDANPAALRLLGQTRARLLGKRIKELLHPEDLADPALAEIRDRVLAGEAVSARLRYLTGHGVHQPFASVISMYDAAKGEFQVVFAESREK